MKRRICLTKCCFVLMVSLLLAACGYCQDPPPDVTNPAPDVTAPAEKMTTLESLSRFDDIRMDGPYVEISVYGEKNYYYTNRNEAFCESLVAFTRSTEFSLKQAEVSDEDHIYVYVWDNNNNSTSFSIYEDDVIEVNRCYYYCEGIYKRFEETFHPFFDESGKHCPSASTPIRHMYEYAVLDKDCKLLDSDYISRQPRLFYDSGIVHWWIQAGTGVLTRCAKFFDVEKGLISPMYYGQTDYYGDLVCTTGSSKVLVYEMFSGEQVCCFDQFEKPLGDCIENICSAYFTKDGKEIIVAYLNADFEKEMQIFAIPQN